jgi:hypothetical protein
MKTPTDQEILSRVEAWFPGAQSFWKPHHDRFEKIRTFTKASGENGQWTDEEVAARNSTNPPRVTLTENLLGPFINQVVNDIKKSDFGAQAKGRDNGTDPKLAEVRQGLHRGIQQIGGFKAALDNAADDLVTGGLGAFRFVTRYADPKSHHKEIEYLELDPTRLFHGDGTNRKRNFSDVTDSLVFEPYSEARFKAEFGKDPKQFLGGSAVSPVWGNGNTPWVSEYFYKDETPEVLVECIDRKSRYVSEVKEILKDPERLAPLLRDRQDLLLMSQLGQALTVDDLVARDEKTGEPISRESTRCQIWWCKIAGREVLQVEAWPGLFIPNFLATGRKVGKAGDYKWFGLAEPAVGVQRAHNYAFSAMVERAGKSPKLRTYAALESIPPEFRGDWDNLATSNAEVLYYNAYRDGDDRLLPVPQQSTPVQTDPAFADLRAMTEQGIRNVLGMWESALGANSQERSGIAIRTRERQADTGNYDWGANLAVAAEHCFVATDEIANKVIDVPTQVRIVGEDDKEEVIWAASLEEDDPNPDGYFDLNRGKYDIVCKMSPSADTKRDEQSQGMEALFEGDPEMRAVLAPEYIALQPWKGAQKLAKVAESYRAMKFPGIKSGDEQADQSQAMAQELQQTKAQLQQAQEQLQKAQQATQENASLKIQNQAVQADKSIEAARLQVEHAQLEIERFKADTDRLKVNAEIANKNNAMLLDADKQRHEQLLASAKTVQDAHAQEHAQQKDRFNAAQGVEQHKDKIGLEGRKLDQAAQAAAQKDAPTGGTGSNADAGRKTVNS